MAQTAQINVKQRPELGSRANKRLRDAGFVPGVIYGHKEAVVPITLPKKEVVNHLSHGAHVFDLAIDGKSEKVLVKEVQYNYLGNEVLQSGDWWITVFPGVTLATLVLAVNLLGDWLRDALNPKLR